MALRPRFVQALGLSLLLAVLPARADLLLVGITESTGPGATAGTSFKNGYSLAIEELNAAGGVLGNQIKLVQHDIDTSPAAAAQAASAAVAERPFAILGPVFSGMTLEAMGKTAGTGIPHFTGAEAVSLTQKFHPSLLRTSLSQAESAPRLGSLVVHGMGARRVGAIWIDNAFGRDGVRVFSDYLRRRGGEIVFNASVKPGQTNFEAVAVQAAAQSMDALLIYCTEAEVSGVIKAVKAAGFSKPIASDGLIAATPVVNETGAAIDGVLAHSNMSIAVRQQRVQNFVTRYAARFGVPPDQNALKGYLAIGVIKAGLEQAGTLDPKAFLAVVKRDRFESARHSMLLANVAYDFFGDLDRESYFIVMKGQRAHVVATVRSAMAGSVELPSGRLVPLNSGEFRREFTQAEPPASTTPRAAPAGR